MNLATSFGGPYVLLPSRLVNQWVSAIEENPDPTTGLYGDVCAGEVFTKCLAFMDSQVIRIAEESSDVFWIPSSRGGFVVQWIVIKKLG